MNPRDARPPASPGHCHEYPDRPLVLLCAGDSCGARHERAGGAALRRWRESVRALPGAVLVTTECLRRCAGPDHPRAVAVVGWRYGEEGVVVDPLAFTGVDEADTSDALAAWMTGRAAAPRSHPFESLPLHLRRYLVR